ncbi:MAG: hemerythrin domain-containing protein [Euryarchaeota archaeon]|nr:hemerythrin domain-containing protein [Euryarchaeota archaeon]
MANHIDLNFSSNSFCPIAKTVNKAGKCYHISYGLRRMAIHLALYTPIHKGLRARLFRVSTKAGTLDYADQAALDAFYYEFEAVGAQMRLHHQWEERGLHPLLASEVPGCAEHLEEEHRKAHNRFDHLITHLDVTRKQSEPENQRALGFEFYLALNRFIAFFLHHLDKEEERAQPALWNLSTTEELTGAVQTSFDVPPEQAKANLVMVIAATNVEELVSLFAHMKESVPTAALQNALNLAERILNARDWETLKSRLESR